MDIEVLIPADIRFPLERANGVQILKTAAALARGGTPTTLFVRQTDPRPTDEILALYGLVPHPALVVRRLPVLHRQGAFTLPRATFLARTVAAAMGARRGAVIYTRDLQLADLLLGLGPVAPGPVVYEAHAVESVMYAERGALYGTGETPNPRKTRRLAKREMRVWRRAAGFVATTSGIRDSFVEAHGPRERLRVIPNGCDVESGGRFPGLAAATPPRVVYAGQLYPWKGVDVLVRAMARVPQARLVVVGGIDGESDTARIRALADSTGVFGRTDLVGTVPQARVAAELRSAAVVAVPFLHTAMSERHTSPIKAFEAMAAGRPIVASDLPSTREFLRHEENALLVPPGDAGALGDAIRRLLECPDLALRIARAAHDEAPRFSWDARATAVRALLEEVR
jgi:glycosyltransferase involved in cell wall biosynthesis